MPAAKSARRSSVSALRVSAGPVVSVSLPECAGALAPEYCHCGGTGRIPLPERYRARAEVDFVGCPRHYRQTPAMTDLVADVVRRTEFAVSKTVSSSAVCLP